MPSNHFILCHSFLLLPPIPPCIRVFSNESTLHMRWAKYWGFSFRISPSKEHSGPISFRMDWLDLLAGQGTLKRLLQHHSSKASILQWSAFFTVQLSHPYMTTGKMSRCFKIKYLFGYTYSLNLSPFYIALPKFHYENLLLKYCMKPDFSVQGLKVSVIIQNQCNVFFSFLLMQDQLILT